MKSKVKTITLCCLIIFLFSACSISDMSGKQSDNTIGIRGTITQLNTIKDGISILVEGEKESDTQQDKASVRIDKNTAIQDSSKNKVKIDEIKVGYKVEIVFAGPVAESYPVQGTAKTVIIISKDDKKLPN